MSKIVKTVADLDGLKLGDSFVIEPEGLPEDPLELLESEAWKLADQIQLAAEERFAPKQADEAGEPDPAGDVKVDIDNGSAVIVSRIDQAVELGGDVRDGTVKLKAGKPTKRKLTSEGYGFVSVNSDRYPY